MLILLPFSSCDDVARDPYSTNRFDLLLIETTPAICDTHNGDTASTARMTCWFNFSIRHGPETLESRGGYRLPRWADPRIILADSRDSYLLVWSPAQASRTSLIG